MSPQALEHVANHVQAHTRAFPLEIGDGEIAGGALDGAKDDLALLTPRRMGLPEAVLKLQVGRLEDVEEVTHIGPRIVLALVPASGGLFEGLVVAVLVLLDDALEADVAADVEPELIALEEQQQPRDAAIAVSERVDAQEVEVEGGEEQQRMEAAVFEGMAPGQDEVTHGPAHAGPGNGLESDTRDAVSVGLDDVQVAPPVPPGVADLAARVAVQIEDRLLRNGKRRCGFVDPPQSIAITADLFFVAVPQGGPAEHDGAEARRSDLHTLDPVRGDRTLDQRMLAERLEALWRLACEERLLALRLAHVREVPRRRHGHVWRVSEELERLHESPLFNEHLSRLMIPVRGRAMRPSQCLTSSVDAPHAQRRHPAEGTTARAPTGHECRRGPRRNRRTSDADRNCSIVPKLPGVASARWTRGALNVNGSCTTRGS